MYILRGKAMAEADRRTIEDLGVPSLLLMEEAGRECLEALIDALDRPVEDLRVLVVCGKGNNGGDGLVLARLLHRRGARVRSLLLWPAEEIEGDPRTNLDALRGLGGEIAETTDLDAFEQEDLDAWDVVVDAVFGTGIRGAVEGWRSQVMEAISETAAFVLSVDLPSGLEADASHVEGPTVRADLTITMAALKPALVLPPACHRAGEVLVGEIGIPENVLEELAELRLVTEEEAFAWAVPLRRAPDTHKGRCGRVLVVAGSVGKSGAAAMTALAALRSGAGLVTLAVPQSAWAGVAPGLPEVMVEPVLEGPSGRIGVDALDRLRELAAEADVLAVGPGLGRAEETSEAVYTLLSSHEGPRVVDADGLYALGRAARDGRIVTGSESSPLYLTPHPGEMTFLVEHELEAVLEDRPGAAREASQRYVAHLLLKGDRTLTVSPGDRSLGVNPTGGPVLATGGTGDVLTGLAAALVAQGVAPVGVLPLAAWVHGMAGELVAEEHGEIGAVATDLLDWLPAVLRALTEDSDAELDDA